MTTIFQKAIRHLDTVPHGEEFTSDIFWPVFEQHGANRTGMSGIMQCMVNKGLIVHTGGLRPVVRGGRASVIYQRTPIYVASPVRVRVVNNPFGALVRSQLVARHA